MFNDPFKSADFDDEKGDDGDEDDDDEAEDDVRRVAGQLSNLRRKNMNPNLNNCYCKESNVIGLK